MMKQFIYLLLIACLAGCSSVKVEPLPDPNDELAVLESARSDVNLDDDDAENHIRMEALRDTARSLGARSGLASRAEQINASVLAQETYLDQMFSFHALLLDDNVVPPVLIESRDALTQASPNMIRVADRNYRIIKQAHFTTLAPTWRGYLIMDDTRPPMPDKSLLPRTDAERAVWQEYVRMGWFEGIDQADLIYTENLARLKRDYQGMVRYRQLLAQNMVSAPQVAHRELGVTGGGEELAINDRTLTIEAMPALRADSGSWEPAVTQ